MNEASLPGQLYPESVRAFSFIRTLCSYGIGPPPARLEYEGKRPKCHHEKFGCGSRTRESLERMGVKVPVRPKSYDFGYRFRHRQSLNQGHFNPSLTQARPPAELEYEGMRLEILALKARDFTAQGNALGKRSPFIQALKGRHFSEMTFVSSRVLPIRVLQCRPFRARFFLFPHSPGVARGFFVKPFQGSLSNKMYLFS